ncbi:MAG TPA: hypothetical protein VMF60_05350 [Acidimicrobiales bacterium]|nr:hypothetical protein [Acidimicrobiales bacterium]
MGRTAKLTASGLLAISLLLGVGAVAGAASTSTTGATATSTPSSKPAKPRVLTGNEIWRIVQPHRGIDCHHATKLLKRVRAAVAAAEKRGGRWNKRQTRDATVNRPRLARAAKRATGKNRSFRKLAQEGQGLISRIDEKCGTGSSKT